MDILVKIGITHVRGNCELECAFRSDSVFVDGVNVGAIDYDWEYCGPAGSDIPHPDGDRQYVGYELLKVKGNTFSSVCLRAWDEETPSEQDVLKKFLREVAGLQKGTKIKVVYDRSNSSKTINNVDNSPI